MPQQRLAKTSSVPPQSTHEPQQWAPRPAQNLQPQTVNALMKEKSDTETAMLFVTASDTQSNLALTGRKHIGSRMATPPLAPVPVTTPSFEPVQPRGKTRLNLLNPMTLLARRRASNNAPSLLPLSNTPNLAISSPPDGYDPRIRGTKVHDFSEPRPQIRNAPYSVMHNLRSKTSGIAKHQRSSNMRPDIETRIREENVDLKCWSGGNHTPVFTEDFNEDRYPSTGPHVQKGGDVTDFPLPRPPCPGEVRKFLRQQSTEENNSQLSRAAIKAGSRSPPSSPGPPVPPKSDIDCVTRAVDAPIENKTTPINTPEHYRALLSGGKRPRNVSEVSCRDSSLSIPKHMKSTSSRFSFDIIGAASQEKLLEDRHRQKALEKKSAGPALNDQDDMYVEDDYDYDNVDDDDGLEERIPGINTDAEDEGYNEISCLDEGTAGFTFNSIGMPVSASPSIPYTSGTISNPIDSNGELIGSAVTREPPSILVQTLQSTVQPADPANIDPKISDNIHSVGNSGLGLQGIGFGEFSDPRADESKYEPQGSIPWQPAVGSDDLYFDDGIIEPPDEDEEIAEFDESVFDNDDTDQYGRPIRSLSSLPTLYSPPFVKSDPSPTDQGTDYSQQASRTSRDLEDLEDLHSTISLRSQQGQMQNHSKIDNFKTISQFSPLQPTPSLTHDTLSDYQSALAAAACHAAASGRFRRDSSPPFHIYERGEHPNSRETTDHNQFSLELTIRQPLSPDYEVGFDDVLGNDPIIAEANAEALANDFEGFYGQEFEFYSAPAAGKAQYGGCFGPRGAEGVVRSQSGRIAGREPNLTPITERSEYSNRNSTMSLPLNGIGHGGSVNSPGLTQLAGLMSEYGEEDMSLSALLKLRRGAWGGSQASLRSSNGNGSPKSLAGEDFSPVSQQPPWTQGGANINGAGQTRKNSTLSLPSDALGCGPTSLSEANSAPSSPTITLGSFSITSPSSASTAPSTTSTTAYTLPASSSPPTTLASSLQALSISTPLLPVTNLSSAVSLIAHTGVESGSTPRRTQGHRHTTSADSISYMQEEDPISGARWVLERRRTAESGEVEILGREVVSGGRI